MTAYSAASDPGPTWRRNLELRVEGDSSPPTRKARRSAATTVAPAVLLVGLLVIVSFAILVAPLSAISGGAPRGGERAAITGPTLLAEAHASAALGIGPGAVAAPRLAPHPGVGPNVSFGVVMTYDAADGYVLAVSLNDSAGPLNNTYGPSLLTWKFAAGNWSLLTTTGAVPATYAPGLVYDAHDAYVLLYGGRLMDTSTTFGWVSNQTWSYKAGVWTNLSTAAPFAVVFPNLVYDAADEYVVLYDEAGLSPTDPNGTLQTTWTYAAGLWTNRTAGAGNPPAWWGEMAYDAADHYVLYFGGYTLTNQLINATYTFHGGSWSNITASVRNAPSPRMNYGMAYDSVHGQVLMYGGLAHLFVYNASAWSYEMWAYSADNWTLLSSNGTTFNTQTMVFDAADNESVLVGTSNLSIEPPNIVTWTYAGNTWTLAAPAFARGTHLTDVGRPLTLDVTQSINGGALVYRYAGLPPGCHSVDAPQLTCFPSSVGTYPVVVTISGAGGFQAMARATVQVDPLPTVLSFTPTSAVGEVGLPIGFAVASTPGSGSLQYAYVGLPPGCASVNSPNLQCVPTAAGSYDVSASVTDAAGGSALGAAHLQVYTEVSVAALQSSRNVLDVGELVTVTGVVAGGVAPYTFDYQGLPSGCATANTSVLACQPTSVGTFTISVQATDGLGAVGHGSNVVTVNARPTVQSLVPSSAKISAGGSIELTATLVGGTAPFAYQYSGLPAGCLGSNDASVTCSGVANGTYVVTVTVTDATGATATATGTFTATTPPHAVIGGPRASGGSSLGFWWGFALSAVVIAIAAVVGGYRLLLARQGEDIVQGLRLHGDGAREGAATELPRSAEDRVEAR
ncbi:MAG: hypothetical protein L3K23_06285 [Thermoplasmata archaeon]|nr:hypothetical protein [Thermoplasmata archaeon]